MFALHWLLARSMVPREYGTYCYALSVVPLLAVVANLGLPNAAIRIVPQYLALGERGRVKGFVRSSWIIVMSASLLVTLVLLPLSWFCLDGDLRTSLIFAVPMLFGLSVLHLLQSTLRAHKHIAASQLPEQCVVPLVLIAAALAFGISGVAITGSRILFVHAMTLAVVGIGVMWFVTKLLRPQMVDVRAQYELREWLNLSVPLAFSSGIWILLTRVDILLIGVTLGSAQVAAYAVPLKLAALMYLGMTALDSILSPMLAEHQARGNQRDIQRLVTTTANWTLLGTIPLFVAFTLFAAPILSLFGSEYRASTNILLILITGQLSTLLVGPVDSVLTMMGHHRAYVRILATTGLGTIILMPAGIYFGGLEGAACVASVSLIIWKIWLARFAYVRIGIKSWALARTT
jgi:O-antigen/teichoic acid export membrane protein